ncbi:MAG: YbhB/YbcL family Raf kinase inhibitor-like protein [Candidatus Omnitrophica bacterium]|nr:YbhB/YbcL family Raf kinase inhibitor-like protein [Candidatus Omnitrophota bacterium]
MKITSPAFRHMSYMPSKYTCDGDDINPPLSIENVPGGTKSLALIMDDPDAPMKTWVHWVVFDMLPDTKNIAENSIPGKQGHNDSNGNNYGGPCPPSGTHRYFFKVYALDKVLGLDEGVTKKDLENAMAGHILAQAELVGLYKRGNR